MRKKDGSENQTPKSDSNDIQKQAINKLKLNKRKSEKEKKQNEIIKYLESNQSGNSNSKERMVDISYIENLLKIPKKTIYRWCQQHLYTGFPHYHIGRHLRFRLSEIDGWLKKYRWSKD